MGDQVRPGSCQGTALGATEGNQEQEGCVGSLWDMHLLRWHAPPGKCSGIGTHAGDVGPCGVGRSLCKHLTERC